VGSRNPVVTKGARSAGFPRFPLASLILFALVAGLSSGFPALCTVCERSLLHQTSTRGIAVAEFLAALQMGEGCFVDQLDSPRNSAFLSLTREGVEPLSILNSLSRIDKAAAASYVASCQGIGGAMFATPDAEKNGFQPEMWGADDAVTVLLALSGLSRINCRQLIEWIIA
jgi:prenyltransferase beta subunit